MKLLILGHANHGKTTVANLFCRHLPHLTFLDSSRAALDIFLWNRLRELGYHYPSLSAAYECRKAPWMRKIWFDEICDYNRDDPARLAKAVLNCADVYVGMRSRREYESCRRQELFDKVIWVDNPRIEPESHESMGIEYDSEMIYISNDCTVDDLSERIKGFSKLWDYQLSPTAARLN